MLIRVTNEPIVQWLNLLLLIIEIYLFTSKGISSTFNAKRSGALKVRDLVHSIIFTNLFPLLPLCKKVDIYNVFNPHKRNIAFIRSLCKYRYICLLLTKL